MSKADRHRAGRCGAGSCREQVRRSPTRSPVFMTQCAASLPLAVPVCWNWHPKRAVSRSFSRPLCVPMALCAYAKSRLPSANAYEEDRKCRLGLRCDFFSAGCARCSIISSVLCVIVSSCKIDDPQFVDNIAALPIFGGRYNQRPHESRAEASRQTRLELSPRTTTITSLDRKSTRLNSSHQIISYAVFCLKKKKKIKKK